MENWIEIHMFGRTTDGAIKINLDNYKDKKLLDILYMPQIKRMLEKMIEEELKKNEEDK